MWKAIAGLFGILCLCAFSRQYNNYDSNENIKSEFINLENTVQDEQFTVVTSTPNLSDMKEGQIVVFSSGAIKIMFRVNQDIYSINGSCITIRR